MAPPATDPATLLCRASAEIKNAAACRNQDPTQDLQCVDTAHHYSASKGLVKNGGETQEDLNGCMTKWSAKAGGHWKQDFKFSCSSGQQCHPDRLVSGDWSGWRWEAAAGAAGRSAGRANDRSGIRRSIDWSVGDQAGVRTFGRVRSQCGAGRMIDG